MHGSLKLIFKENNFGIRKFYVIYLKNVIIGLIQTHEKCHSLCMDTFSLGTSISSA
jgi:hypothetical protein